MMIVPSWWSAASRSPVCARDRIGLALGDPLDDALDVVAQPDDQARRIDEPHDVEEVRQQQRPADDREAHAIAIAQVGANFGPIM